MNMYTQWYVLGFGLISRFTDSSLGASRQGPARTGSSPYVETENKIRCLNAWRGILGFYVDTSIKLSSYALSAFHQCIMLNVYRYS